MNGNVEWPGFLYFLAVLLYIVILYGIKRFERRTTQKTLFSDEDYLTLIARQKECSEYDIFCLATEDWRISKARAENDFNEYLKHGYLPFYVKDFVRKNRDDAC